MDVPCSTSLMYEDPCWLEEIGNQAVAAAAKAMYHRYSRKRVVHRGDRPAIPF
jgi:hypothetical protein